MIDFITSMFSGPAGNISSKRVMAVILILAGIVYAFIKADPAMCGILIGGGVGLLGVQAVSGT